MEKSHYKRTVVEFRIDKAELPSLSPERLVAKMDSAAQAMAEKTSKHVFEKLREVTTKTGQVHDAQGRPFCPDVFLETLEMMDVDFDERANQAV